jgi:hypothetical protein
VRPIADSPESRAHVIGRETRESCMVHGACNVERVAARRIPVDPGGARSVPGFAAAGAKACAVRVVMAVYPAHASHPSHSDAVDGK